MLLKYSVTNFKSIGETIEFTMFPLENKDNEHLMTIKTKVGDWKILKRGVLFGPNASGKTAFIDSISYSQEYVLKGAGSNKITRINQFKGFSNNLTTFQYIFYINGDVFEYGFSLDSLYVHEEWLYILNENAKMIPLFKRITDSKKITKIEITSDYAIESSDERKLAEVLKSSIKENQANQLFLKKLFENASSKAEIIMSWFEKIQVIYPSTKLQALPLRVKEDISFREFLSTQLRNMDTGVYNISATTREYTIENFKEQYNLPDDIIREIEEKESGFIRINGKYYIFSEEKKGHAIFVRLEFEHHLNGKNVPLDLEEESDGTRRMVDLLPIIFNVSTNVSDKIYFVDELDRSLHTKLSKEFIKKFEEYTNAQLIFTAHDVNLLDLTLFRAEEIWFVEKKDTGETRFKPFSDFTTKDGQNILKDYLNGRFGAIPFLNRGNEYDE